MQKVSSLLIIIVSTLVILLAQFSNLYAETFEEKFARLFELVESGPWDSTLSYSKTILKECELEFGEDVRVAQVKVLMAASYGNLSLMDSALAVMKEAMDLSLKAGGAMDTTYATSTLYYGAILRYKERLKEAEEYIIKGHEIRSAVCGEKSGPVGESLWWLATIYDELGKVELARPLFDSSFAIKETVLGPYHPELAVNLVRMAYNHQNDNELTVADSLYKRALDIRARHYGKNNYYYASVLTSYSDLLEKMGNLDSAEALCLESLPIQIESHGKQHYRVGFTINQLASLASKRGDIRKADSLFKIAIGIVERASGVEHTNVAICLESNAFHLAKSKKFRAALKPSHRAYTIRRDHFFRNCFSVSEKQALEFSKSFRWTAQQSYLTYWLNVSIHSEIDHRQAADVILNIKGPVSDLVISRRRNLMDDIDSSTTDIVSQWNDIRAKMSHLFNELANEKKSTVIKRHIDSLDNLAEAIENNLVKQNPEFSNRIVNAEITASQIANALAPGRVVLEYLKTDYYDISRDNTISRYLVAIINNDDHPYVLDLGSADSIDGLVHQYRNHINHVSMQSHAPGTDNISKEYRDIAFKLYEKIIAPTEEFLGDYELLIFAPDGELNLIPISSLVDSTQKFLIEKTPIHFVSSARDIVRSRKSHGTTEKQLVAFGDPDFDASLDLRKGLCSDIESKALYTELNYSRNLRSSCDIFSNGSLTKLAFSRHEVLEIANVWRENFDDTVNVYLGANASEDRLKHVANQSRLLHIATHGFYVSGRCQVSEVLREHPLLQSGIFMAGANSTLKENDNPELDDGILTAYEIASLDLSGTDMVVLSACESGLGEVVNGEGVYGLRRAFQIAGAGVVVSTLWPVSDLLTSEMTVAIYENMNTNIAQRIREMQLQQINRLRKNGISDHPYSWAGFVAFGNLSE